MQTLFYLHFNEQELKERLKSLSTLKINITPHFSTEQTAAFSGGLPDIFVVSLDRLPSHGRQYVQWLWEAKKRQQIPVIFVDGKPDKIAATQIKFPAAIYCTSRELPAVIKTLLKKPA